MNGSKRIGNPFNFDYHISIWRDLFFHDNGIDLPFYSQARFVILQVLIESGENFVSVQEVVGPDGQPDLLLTMDKSKLESVGKPSIGQFLKKLQVFKSLGDFASANAMFSKYSKVNEQWLSWRDIVISRKQPRKMQVQANTFIQGNHATISTVQLL